MNEQFAVSEAGDTDSFDWLREVRPFQSDDWSVRARGAVEKARVDLLLGEPNAMIATLPAFLGGAPLHRDDDTQWTLAVVRAVYGRALYARDGAPGGQAFLTAAEQAADHSIPVPSTIDLEDAADLAAALRLLERPAEAARLVEELALHVEERARQPISWPWRVRYEYARALRDAGRVADAEQELRRALSIKPGEPNLLAEHAWCLGTLGDRREAAKEAILAARGFDARDRSRERDGAVGLACELDPDWPPVLMIRAQHELVEGRGDAALALLDDASEAMTGQDAYESIRAWALESAGRTTEALDVATAVLANRPSDWSMLFLTRRALSQQDRVGAVLPLLERAREIDGDTAGLLFLTAETYDELDDQVDKAREFYQRTLDLLPYYVQCLQALGKLEARQGSYDAARQAFERITAIEPANTEAQFLLGLVLRLQNDLPAAAEAFTIAVEDIPEALTARGEIKIQLGDAEAGMADLRAAVERAPTNPEVVLPCANALLTRDVDEATAVLRDWVAQSGYTAAAAHRAGAMLVEREFAEAALPFLREAAADDEYVGTVRPTLIEALYQTDDWQGLLDVAGTEPDVLPPIAAAQVGRALEEFGRLDDAFRWADSAVAREPKNSAVLTVRGNIQRARRAFKEAENDLRAALVAEPGNAWAKGALGRVLRESGNPAEAVELLAEYVDAGLASPQARAEYADALVLTGQAATALEHVESASADAPDSAWILGIFGTTLRVLNRFDEALEKLTQATQLPNPPSWVAWERVMCLLQADRVDEAVRYARETAAQLPEDPKPRAALGVALAIDERYSESVEVLSAPDVQLAAPSARGQRASALISLGRHDEAIAELTDLLANGDDDGWNRTQLGIAYLRREPPAPDLALDVVAPVEGADADLIVWLVRGDAELLRRHSDRARSHFETAEHVGKNAGLVDANALHGLGWIALKLGRPRDAVRLLNRGTDIRATSSMYIDLGLATLHTSRADEAIASYRRGLELIRSKDDDAALRGACLVASQDLERMLSSTGTLKAGEYVDEVRDLLRDTMSSVSTLSGTFTGPADLSIGTS